MRDMVKLGEDTGVHLVFNARLYSLKNPHSFIINVFRLLVSMLMAEISLRTIFHFSMLTTTS